VRCRRKAARTPPDADLRRVCPGPEHQLTRCIQEAADLDLPAGGGRCWVVPGNCAVSRSSVQIGIPLTGRDGLPRGDATAPASSHRSFLLRCAPFGVGRSVLLQACSYQLSDQ
jgi:hypothetical protein